MTTLFRYTGIAFRTTSVFGCIVYLLISAAAAYQDEDCIACHGDRNMENRLTINIAEYANSVHAAGFKCADCHRGVTSDYHISKVGSGAVNCIDCHQTRNQHGGKSAEGVRPTCQQCHTRHKIFRKSDRASSVHPKNIVGTCQQCHPEESGEVSFLSRLPAFRIESHNKQNFRIDYSPDNCLGCHQGRAAHGEIQDIVSDECSNCHLSSDGENAMLGLMHPKADPEKQAGVYAASLIYQMIVVLIFWFGFRWISRKRLR